MAFNAETYKRIENQLGWIKHTTQPYKQYQNMFKTLDTGLSGRTGLTALRAFNQTSPAIGSAKGIKNIAAISGFAQLNSLLPDANSSLRGITQNLIAPATMRHIGTFKGQTKHMAGLNGGLVSGAAAKRASAYLQSLHASTTSTFAAGFSGEIATNAGLSLLARSTPNILDSYKAITLPWLLREKQTVYGLMVKPWQQPGLGTALTAAVGSDTALNRIAEALRNADRQNVRTVRSTAVATVTERPPFLVSETDSTPELLIPKQGFDTLNMLEEAAPELQQRVA